MTKYNYKFKYFDLLRLSKEKLKDSLLIEYIPGTHGEYLALMLNSVYENKFCQPEYGIAGRAHIPGRGKESKFYPFHSAYEPELFELLRENDRITIVIDTYEGMLLTVMLALYRTRPPDVVDLENLTEEQFEELNPVSGKLNYGWGNLIFNNLIRPFSRASLRHTLATHVMPGMNDYYLSIKDRLLSKSVCQVSFESFFEFDTFFKSIEHINDTLKLSIDLDSQKVDMRKSFDEFQQKNPFCRTFRKVNTVVEQVRQRIVTPIPKLHISVEALINYRVKKEFGVDLMNSEVYCMNTSEILDQLK